jgi:hypothetical protein
MNGSDSIPITLLNTIRGQNIDITLMLGDGIEWIINGMDIKSDASDIPEVNLKVTLYTDSIPMDIISGAGVSSDNSIQMSLTYEGDFGFTAKLKLNINKENKGRLANLFYYNPVTEQLEFQSVSRIDDQGNIILGFSHASDYIIIMDDEVLIEDAIQRVTINTRNNTLYIGGNKDTGVKVDVILPDNIKQAISDGLVDYSVNYQSGDNRIAIVDSNGKVNAKSVGEVEINTTLTIGKYKKHFITKITVKKAFIRLLKSTYTMKKGKVFTFNAVGYGVDTQKIKWKTTMKSVVVIDKKTGIATAKSTGTDYVIAYSGSITKKIKVIVTK